MAEFTYKARNADGKNLSGTIVADSPEDAKSELRRQGFQIMDLTAKGGGAGGLSSLTSFELGSLFKVSKATAARRAKVKLEDLNIFTRQLATMLSAGIPLLECLEILAEQLEDPGFQAVLEMVVEDVRSGSDFSESLRKHPRCFSGIYTNMIKAGEASGQLDEILTRLAEYQEASAELKQKIKSAMTYPAISLVMIISVTMGLLIFIIPKFEAIFRGMNVELPGITVALLMVSKIVTQYYILVGLGMVAMFVGVKFYAKTNMGSYQVDWLKLRVPIFGPLFQKVAISRFAKTLATLIQSGVPILGALEIVAATSGNRIIESAVLDASTSVRQGETLAAPLGKASVFPPMVVRMIAIGEKSGALENLLEKISEFYDQQVSATVESLTALIEPIMIGVMGVIVGGMVLAVFLPIFKLAGSIH
ncbi:type II secretion system F family protein [Planctomycetota bacterium]